MTDKHPALARAFQHATQYLDSLETRPVTPTASTQALRARLSRPLQDKGVPPEQVIDELVADADPGILGSQGGRHHAWVIGGGLPGAMAADWMTTIWDQNAGIAACGPAASVVEEIAEAWLVELFDLPKGTSIGFVTGAQMAHVTCLAAARHSLLQARGWDVGRQGLFGAPPIRVLANADRHTTMDRALRLLGIGLDAVEGLPVDAAGDVTPQVLETALKASDRPTIVALQAGELNLAAFDPFAQLAPLARSYGAWTHVDAAFGLWAKVSPAHRHLVEGLELCDSWATDGHKYLNVPYDSGFAIVRDAEAHRAAMTVATSYLPAADAARDEVDWNPEFSRRARGFAVYAAIRELGREGLADLIDRTCRHAQAIVDGIGALPGAEKVAGSAFNQGLVRFLGSDGDHDRRTDEIIAAINATGEAYFGGVTWRGKRCMRVSLCNWRTTEQDVERAIAAAAQALGVNS
jgi:glutamate/tyrosine decarboxylase-like PLP-dependent enzyme